MNVWLVHAYKTSDNPAFYMTLYTLHLPFMKTWYSVNQQHHGSLVLSPLHREEGSGDTQSIHFSVPIAKKFATGHLHSLITSYNQINNNASTYTSHMHNDTNFVKASA